MTSLDGYSLNEKMDKEFKEIKKQIEVLKFRIEAEMKDIAWEDESQSGGVIWQ